MPDRPFLSRFTPSRTDPAILEAIFVQRHELADDTVERIHESALSGNKHHLLFIGPRGSGKTHFVSLIFHRVSLREDLHERLRIAWLGEDETATSFLDLLLRIYRALQQRYANEFPAEALEALYQLSAAAAAKRLGKLLLEKLAGRTLLVIVENVDALFAGLKAAGQKQWRAFIQENAVFTTLATSQQLCDGVSRRDSAFFGFFRTEHLRPLTVEEAVLLLKKIADLSKETEDKDLAGFLQTPAGRARVRALHHLSGGNHRIYIVLSEFITRATLDELIGPFEKMIDELTPYYQARVKGLSPQQRKLVEFLCACRQPVPVTQIARSLFMTHQTATSQLKDLREKGYVQSQPRGRESLYELTEPLMRICVEVKENRREPIRLIVDFLRIWYTPEQLRTLPARSSLEQLYVQSASQAIDRGEEDLRVRSIICDLDDQRQRGQPKERIRMLEELSEIRGDVDDWVEFADALQKDGRHAESLAACNEALERDPKNPSAWFRKGVALGNTGRDEEGLAAFEKALEFDPKRVIAWNNRGIALGKLGRYEEALAAFEQACALDPKSVYAWNGRGIALENLGRYEEALAAYDQARELDPKSVHAWNGRGIALENLGRYEEALAAYDQARELDPKSVHAWSNRGDALRKLGRNEEALAAYDQARELDPKSVYAWIRRGIALDSLGRYAEALAAFDKARDLDPKFADAWNGRGIELENLGRYAEALAAFDKARELEPTGPSAAFKRVEVLLLLDRWEPGFAALKHSLKEFPPSLKSYAGDTEALVKIMMTGSLEKATWKQRASRLVAIYGEAQALTYLGEGLVRSLATISANMLSAEALAAWRDVWHEAGAGHDQLIIPLRIFAAGIRYLQTKDRRVLLDLLTEERRILAEALSIDPEGESG